MPHTTWTTAGVAALRVVDRLRRVRETSSRHGPEAEEKGAGEGTDGSARAPPSAGVTPQPGGRKPGLAQTAR